MKEKFIKFLRDEEGLTMVEYAVAGGLVCAIAVAAFQLLGQNIGRVINGIANLLGGIPIP